MKRITVTGATGFIGRRLVEHLLLDRYDVTVLLRPGSSPKPFGQDVRVLRGDVTAPMTLAGDFSNCDLVIHLAGCTVARSKGEFHRVNRDGTLNVAKACAAQETPPRLLFVSSLAAAGPALRGRPLRESDPPQPVSEYGRSKLAAEDALREMADELSIQIVRPPTVFGDSDTYMLGLFKAAKAGWVFLPGSGEPRYSLIHVDDLARALIHLSAREEVCGSAPVNDETKGGLESDGKSELVYLCQSPPMSFSEIAAIINDAMGKGKTKSVHVPSALCWGLAATNSLAAQILRVKPLLNLDKMREAMAGEWTGDSGRLTGELGFQFQVSLEQRIRDTAKSYREKQWL